MPDQTDALAAIDDYALMDQIAQFVADATDLNVKDIGPDMDLFTELGLDSLGIVMVHVEMAMMWRLPEPAPELSLKPFNTVAKLAAYVRSHAR